MSLDRWKQEINTNSTNDEKKQSIIKDMVFALQTSERVAREKITIEKPPISALYVDVFALQPEWQPVKAIFATIFEKQKKIFLNPNDKDALKIIQSEMKKAANYISQWAVSESNLNNTVLLVYVLLACYDKDKVLFLPIYDALNILVNKYDLLRARIPSSLMTREVKNNPRVDIAKYESEIKALQQEITTLSAKIFSLKEKIDSNQAILLDTKESELLRESPEDQIILFNPELAGKCQELFHTKHMQAFRLTRDEIESWKIASQAKYGSTILNVLSTQAKKMFGISTVEAKNSPKEVMSKLKQILQKSDERHAAIAASNATFEALQAAKKKLENCIANQKIADELVLEVKQILDSLKDPDQFEYFKKLLAAKHQLISLKKLEQYGKYKNFIQDNINLIRSHLFKTLNNLMQAYEIKKQRPAKECLNRLVKIRNEMKSKMSIPASLNNAIQEAYLEKAWESTYDIYQPDGSRRKFRQYFIFYSSAGFLPTIFCDVLSLIFIFPRNIAKLFTEALPKYLLARLDNRAENKKTNYPIIKFLLKVWFIYASALTSPRDSWHAARVLSKNIENKFFRFCARLLLFPAKMISILSLPFLFSFITRKIIDCGCASELPANKVPLLEGIIPTESTTFMTAHTGGHPSPKTQSPERKSDCVTAVSYVPPSASPVPPNASPLAVVKPR